MIRRLAPVIAVAGLVLAACGSGDDSTAEPTTTPAAPAATDPTTEPTEPAPTEPASTEPAGSAPTSAEPAPTTPPSSSPSDGGSGVLPENVPEALQFAAPLIGGGDIELTTLAGRPVLLWFWAPW